MAHHFIDLLWSWCLQLCGIMGNYAGCVKEDAGNVTEKLFGPVVNTAGFYDSDIPATSSVEDGENTKNPVRFGIDIPI
ncbi:uncharacterized protein ARMOST_22247 [Armillaria ostoyae]|uniref:Uncharacterized protein n=1 Tax=Armillaria ostoyae TaxID=47428 RepID=A0A284SCD2_ARMOS|nr:uncharacterized protein ARMOST_22247 [Armillaria ostoyae]